MLSALALLVAFVFPQYGSVFQGKESLLLMGILFFNLLSVSAKDVLLTTKTPLSMILSLLALSGVFTALVYMNREAIDEKVFIGLILAGTSGISFTGIMIANIFGGDKARILVLTLVSFCVSAFVIGLFVPEMNGFDLILDTAIFFLVPTFFAGLFRLSPYGEAIEKHGSYFSLLLFVVYVYSIISSLNNLDISMNIIYYATAFCLINLFFGFVIGKNKEEKIAFSSATVLRNYEVPLLFSISALSPETSIVIMGFMVVSYVFMIPVLAIISKK